MAFLKQVELVLFTCCTRGVGIFSLTPGIKEYTPFLEVWTPPLLGLNTALTCIYMLISSWPDICLRLQNLAVGQALFFSVKVQANPACSNAKSENIYHFTHVAESYKAMCTNSGQLKFSFHCSDSTTPKGNLIGCYRFTHYHSSVKYLLEQTHIHSFGMN